jgi:heptaprenyl diphosphate synthase
MGAPRSSAVTEVQTRASLPELERITPDELLAAVGGHEQKPELARAVRHVLASSGDPLRAGICFGTAKYGTDPRADAVSTAAAAVELFHAASLAHDDIVDGGELRRGWASLGNEVGSRTARGAASWMFERAARLVASAGEDVGSVFRREVRELCDGQSMDAEDVFDTDRTPARYMSTIDKKTASLFRAAAAAGALAARADDDTVSHLTRFGHHLGLLAQLSDDILDIGGSDDAVGGPAGSDLRHGVYTLPLIYAIEAEPTLPNQVPHVAIDETVFTRVVGLVVGCGALQRAFADCQEQYRLALAALMSADTADPAAAERLSGVADYLLDRAAVDAPPMASRRPPAMTRRR